MGAVSANSLFHFTNSFENLVSILKNGFYIKYTIDYVFFGHVPGFAYKESKDFVRVCQMVCLCDIPLSQIHDHVGKYGKYGVGLNKSWGIENALNPILYVDTKSDLYERLSEILDYLREIYNKEVIISANTSTGLPSGRSGSQSESISLEVLKKVWWGLLSYIKSYSGPLYRRNKKPKNIIFYDEKEWRYSFGTQSYSTTQNLKSVFARIDKLNKNRDVITLNFTAEDVRHLIVRYDNQIPKLVEKLNEIFPDSKDIQKRVTSCEEIEKDNQYSTNDIIPRSERGG